MSIWQKIKTRWIVYQEKRRAWWIAPICHTLNDMQRQIINIEVAMVKSAAETRRMLGQRIDEAEGRVLDNLLEHRHHLGTVDNNIGKVEESTTCALKNLTEQLDGIRSRYKWVEDRYNDMAKGKKPREFDYEHRQ